MFVRTQEENDREGALTPWRRQREELVRALKESHRERGAHSLEMADRRTCQDTERNQLSGGTHELETVERETHQDMEGKRPSEGHSQTGDNRGTDLSGHGEKVTE